MTYEGPPGPDEVDRTEPESIVYLDQPGPDSFRPRHRTDPWTIVLGVVGGALVGTGLTLGILGATGVFEEPPLPTAPTLPPPPTLTIPPPAAAPPAVVDPGVTRDVAARAIPSIVAVETVNLLGDGGGSGVVYGIDGYIITNHHVIDGASGVTVVFADGARYPAEIIGSDPLTDLAVLRIRRTDLSPIDIGSSGDIDIGDMAVAVGNPLALLGGPSVTSGIVSALGRSLALDSGTTLYGLVQTDAPITRGSSGGALLDGTARLIGITTAIAVSDVGAEGLGFAIPIDMVIGVVNDLIEFGEVEHALIGIQGTTALAEQEGAQYPAGIIVQDLLGQSPYEDAGGQVNDVVIAMNGDAVSTLNELLTRLRMHRAGEEMIFTVQRADGELDLIVVLGRLAS